MNMVGLTFTNSFLAQLMMRGMKEPVGRTWKGVTCKNNNLDVLWVQIMLNELINHGQILTAETDKVPLNGLIKATEIYGIPGPTVRAIIAIQMHKLHHRIPSGQIHPDDATHAILRDWKRPIPIEIQFEILQEAALASTEWTENREDQEMKGALEILINSKEADDEFLHKKVVQDYMENRPGATLYPFSLSRILFNEFKKRIDGGKTVDPVQWVKFLRTQHEDILSTRLQITRSSFITDCG